MTCGKCGKPVTREKKSSKASCQCGFKTFRL